MGGLAAFIATMDYMESKPVIQHLWSYGARLVAMLNQQASAFGIAHSFKAAGVACSPYYTTTDAEGKPSPALRTLFSQEMIKSGVLMPWIALSYRHQEAEFAKTEQAVQGAFDVYSRAFAEGVDKYLVGPAIQPVFRKYN
jgi:glutamate-1-semialdehyde 2,1-aminomutase